jgi:hypothetical protein
MTLKELVDALEERGYYKYAVPEDIAKLKNHAVRTGYVYHFADGSKRCYRADSESLAECGFEGFLNKIEMFLHKQGIIIHSLQTQCNYPREYSVTIDGIGHQIFSAEESASTDVWELATKRCFSIVNGLLEQAGSSERLYQLYSANDTGGVFLTEQLYQLILRSQALPKDEMPVSVVST